MPLRGKSSLTRLTILGAIPGIALLAYVLHNYAYAGSLLPVSAIFKHGSWLAANFYYFLLSFIPIAVIHSDVFWSEGTMRTLQLCVPVLLALIMLAHWAKRFKKDANAAERSNHHNEIVLAGLCLYVLLKGAYNFAFVKLWGQGHWYFPLSVMIFNLVLATVIGSRIKGAWGGRRAVGLGVASLALVVLLGNAFVTHKLLTNYNGLFYEFWVRRSSIQSQLQSLDPEIRIIEYDDGILSYTLDIPTMSGFGYTLDHAAIQAKSRGQLLQLAYDRGFHVIGLLYYYTPSLLQTADDPEGLLAIVRGIPNLGAEDLTQWQFSILYKDPRSRALFIQFEPASATLDADMNQ